MNKEKKIIIIGIIATILTLIIAGLIFYLIYNNTKEENNNNLNENVDTSTNVDDNTINNENDNNTSVSNPSDNEIDTPTSGNNTEKTVTVYLFRGKGCPHCEHAIEFLESIIDDYSYLNVVSYEVWYNEENDKLMEEVANELGVEASSSVPFIVIGNEYARRGFSDGMTDGIIKEIENSYQNENYEDIVKKVLENNNFNIVSETINEK